MDRRAIDAIETAVLAVRLRVAPLWPFAVLGIAVVVAACGNGGGSGY